MTDQIIKQESNLTDEEQRVLAFHIYTKNLIQCEHTEPSVIHTLLGMDDDAINTVTDFLLREGFIESSGKPVNTR